VLGTDNTTSLEARVRGAEEFGADYFISLHINSFSDASVRGLEMLVFAEDTEAYSFGKSVLDSLAVGDWSVFFRFSVASLICGLCWETWNYHACAKWIYAVPYVHRFQIWEMPLIGFAGYLPFGVECAAVTAWISPMLIGVGKRAGGAV
jgi:hypothetical protein